MLTRTLRAAQYVRMSTERQEYSPTFQMAANETYASLHGMEIVRTYEDAGVSGLSLRNRDGLKALLADVISGTGGYSHVLVYDVSRWGRFQNPDQAAYYEFMCAQAGVTVAYCAETFENDGSPASGLLKHIKRTMAAEYSRDLSERVTRAQRGLLARGFWIGGKVPLGYRREFARSDGTTVAAPSGPFVRKQQGVRTKLILASDAEVDCVRKVFQLFLKPNATSVSVARLLSKDPTVDADWGEWSAKRVRYVLDNEVYLGRLLGGRCDRPVGVKSGGMIPRSDWIVIEDAVPPIVSKKMFDAVRRKRKRKAVTRTEALADLRRIGQEKGYISQNIIKRYGRWSTGVYYRQVGSLETIRTLLDLPLPERFANHFRLRNTRRGGGTQKYSLEQLRKHLAKALAEQGRLSREVLDAYGTPSAYTIGRRFGSMEAAYLEVGYEPDENQRRRFEKARRVRAERVGTRPAGHRTAEA